MHAQTQDVIGVFSVESLCVLLLVIDHAHGGHVVHDVRVGQVEQAITAVIAAVSEIRGTRRQSWASRTGYYGSRSRGT